MRKTVIIFLACILLILSAIGMLLFQCVLPQRDTLQTGNIPQEFRIDTTYNYIDFQQGNECSAYASAYVMRHLGKQITGNELYQDIHRILGFVPVHRAVNLLQRYGCQAKAYHGDLNTMKSRLLDGVPIIAFTNIPGDTHYVVIVGYDADFIYLADSIAVNSNEDGGWYNRKLRAEEFEEIWNTNIYPVRNIYIAVNQE